MLVTVVTHPNEERVVVLGVDLMGSVPGSYVKQRDVYLVVDYYTHWVELFPLKKATAAAIAQILRQEIFTRRGVPDHTFSDHCSQFVSSLYKELCRLW